jgi:hypothetical protein
VPVHDVKVHVDITFIMTGSDIKLVDDNAVIDPLVELKENKFP